MTLREALDMSMIVATRRYRGDKSPLVRLETVDNDTYLTTTDGANYLQTKVPGLQIGDCVVQLEMLRDAVILSPDAAATYNDEKFLSVGTHPVYTERRKEGPRYPLPIVKMSEYVEFPINPKWCKESKDGVTLKVDGAERLRLDAVEVRRLKQFKAKSIFVPKNNSCTHCSGTRKKPYETLTSKEKAQIKEVLKSKRVLFMRYEEMPAFTCNDESRMGVKTRVKCFSELNKQELKAISASIDISSEAVRDAAAVHGPACEECASWPTSHIVSIINENGLAYMTAKKEG